MRQQQHLLLASMIGAMAAVPNLPREGGVSFDQPEPDGPLRVRIHRDTDDRPARPRPNVKLPTGYLGGNKERSTRSKRKKAHAKAKLRR